MSVGKEYTEQILFQLLYFLFFEMPHQGYNSIYYNYLSYFLSYLKFMCYFRELGFLFVWLLDVCWRCLAVLCTFVLLFMMTL